MHAHKHWKHPSLQGTQLSVCGFSQEWTYSVLIGLCGLWERPIYWIGGVALKNTGALIVRKNIQINVYTLMGKKKKSVLKCLTYSKEKEDGRLKMTSVPGKIQPNPVSPELHVRSNINTVRVICGSINSVRVSGNISERVTCQEERTEGPTPVPPDDSWRQWCWDWWQLGGEEQLRLGQPQPVYL